MNNEFDDYRALVGGKVLLPEVLCQIIHREKLESAMRLQKPRDECEFGASEEECTTVAKQLLDELVVLGFEDIEPRVDLLSSKESFFRDVIDLIDKGYANVEDAVLKHYKAGGIVEALELLAVDLEINDHRMAKDALSRFKAAAESEDYGGPHRQDRNQSNLSWSVRPSRSCLALPHFC